MGALKGIFRGSLNCITKIEVATENAEAIKNMLYEAGAGKIGNYDFCGFTVEGKGNFRPIDGANPFIGEIGKLETVNETRIEFIMPQH